MVDAAARIRLSELRAWWPRRKPNAHKGTFGRVYILAGSKGMTGAAVLCATGALRSGAGLVRLGVPGGQQTTAARRAPLEVMTDGLAEDAAGRFSARANRDLGRIFSAFPPDVIAAGPGFRDAPGPVRMMRSVWRKFRLPTVLDADGLRALPEKGNGNVRLVVTPHPGEMGRMTGRSIRQVENARIETAVAAARRWRCVCVLKGAGSVVTDGRRVWVNSSGNPGMASGGTGDVLTGVIAGIWGQLGTADENAAFQAACLGVYLHGRAGDLAARDLGRPGMTASDLVARLPIAIKGFIRP